MTIRLHSFQQSDMMQHDSTDKPRRKHNRYKTMYNNLHLPDVTNYYANYYDKDYNNTLWFKIQLPSNSIDYVRYIYFYNENFFYVRYIYFYIYGSLLSPEQPANG